MKYHEPGNTKYQIDIYFSSYIPLIILYWFLSNPQSMSSPNTSQFQQQQTTTPSQQ